jgi:hypothetical protein
MSEQLAPEVMDSEPDKAEKANRTPGAADFDESQDGTEENTTRFGGQPNRDPKTVPLWHSRILGEAAGRITEGPMGIDEKVEEILKPHYLQIANGDRDVRLPEIDACKSDPAKAALAEGLRGVARTWASQALLDVVNGPGIIPMEPGRFDLLVNRLIERLADDAAEFYSFEGYDNFPNHRSEIRSALLEDLPKIAEYRRLVNRRRYLGPLKTNTVPGPDPAGEMAPPRELFVKDQQIELGLPAEKPAPVTPKSHVCPLPHVCARCSLELPPLGHGVVENAEQTALKKNIEDAAALLQLNPAFSSVMLRIHERLERAAQDLPREAHPWLTPARMAYAIARLDIQAEELISLVLDIPTQNAFAALLDTMVMPLAWGVFTGATNILPHDEQSHAKLDVLRDRAKSWKIESYKRLVASTPDKGNLEIFRGAGDKLKSAVTETAEPKAEAGPKATFRKNCAGWELSFAGKSVYVAHSKGMAYILHLLRAPDQSLYSVQLLFAAAGRDSRPWDRGTTSWTQPLSMPTVPV